MKLKLFIAGLLLYTLGNAQVMWQVKKDTIIKWYYYDGDEFNGSAYDQDKWIPAYSWTEVNFDLKYRMTPNRLLLDSGVCHFMCYRDTGFYKVPGWLFDSVFVKKYRGELQGDQFKYYFTAGNVWSKAKYGRGYFEIRFKTTDVYGMWPAFWLFGDEKDEIDLFELKGERSRDIHVDVHCVNGCDGRSYKGDGIFRHLFGGWIRSTRPLSEGYNIVSGEWQNGYVKWYLNGQGIAIYKGDFGSKAMNLMIGTGPAEDGKAFSPGVKASSVFPNSFDVDYVRVWYRDKKPAQSGRHNGDFDYREDRSQRSFLKKKIGYMYSKAEFDKDLFTISLLPKKNRKVILTCLGKDSDYTITFYDADNKQLLSRTIKDDFSEFDLEGLTQSPVLKVRIEVAGRILEDKLELK